MVGCVFLPIWRSGDVPFGDFPLSFFHSSFEEEEDAPVSFLLFSFLLPLPSTFYSFPLSSLDSRCCKSGHASVPSSLAAPPPSFRLSLFPRLHMHTSTGRCTYPHWLTSGSKTLLPPSRLPLLSSALTLNLTAHYGKRAGSVRGTQVRGAGKCLVVYLSVCMSVFICLSVYVPDRVSVSASVSVSLLSPYPAF